MSYISIQSESDILRLYSHIQVGSSKFALKPFNAVSAQVQSIIPYRDFGILVDQNNGVAAINPATLPHILASGSIPNTIDEPLNFGIVIPDEPADGTLAGWVGRNNIRYHCEHRLDHVVALNTDVIATLQMSRSGDMVVAQGQASIALDYSEDIIDGGVQENRKNAVLGVEQRMPNTAARKTYVGILFPNISSLLHSQQDRSRYESLRVCVQDSLLQNALQSQNWSYSKTQSAGVLPTQFIDGKTARDNFNLEVWVDSLMDLNLYVDDGNMFIPSAPAGERESEFFIGYGHLCYADLQVIFKDQGETKSAYYRSTFLAPEREADNYIYQIKNPLNHSNGIGLKEDLLVPVAKIPTQGQ